MRQLAQTGEGLRDRDLRPLADVREIGLTTRAPNPGNVVIGETKSLDPMIGFAAPTWTLGTEDLQLETVEFNFVADENIFNI